MNVANSPQVEPLVKGDNTTKAGALPSNNKVHPFMLECVFEEKRRASAVISREAILSYASSMAERSDDNISSSNFDENKMMFGGGGDKYMKVSVLEPISKLL